MHSIQRFLEDAKTGLVRVEQQKALLQEENIQFKASIIPLENKVQQLTTAEQEIRREKRDVERKLTQSQRQVTQTEAQSAIFRKEIENLQALIKTFDDLPLSSSSLSSEGDSSSKMDNSKKTLELSLATKQGELKVVTEENDRCNWQ